MRGRERVGLSPECVYGTEVTVRACYVNLCLCVFSLPGHVCGYLIPTPQSESCGAGLIGSVVVCVFTCIGICMCVVTGSLNSTVQA